MCKPHRLTIMPEYLKDVLKQASQGDRLTRYPVTDQVAKEACYETVLVCHRVASIADAHRVCGASNTGTHDGAGFRAHASA
jgi:hypothetical protein